MTIGLPRPWRRMPRQGRQAGPAWTLLRPWTRRALVHRLVENLRAGFPQRPLASSSAGRRRQPNGCHDVNQASHTEFLTVPPQVNKIRPPKRQNLRPLPTNRTLVASIRLAVATTPSTIHLSRDSARILVLRWYSTRHLTRTNQSLKPRGSGGLRR
jgi:hypothetical protein